VAISAWPFRGREAELALIGQAIDDPAVSGIVVAGEAGVGKTRLAFEALSQADSERYLVKRAVATDAARSIPLGALAQLLPAELPSANLLRAATEALVAVGGQQHLLLGMDDAQLLDDVSAALLHQIVQSGAAFVLLTLRSGEPAPDPVTALWKERTIERFDLLPLSPLEVEHVLVAALDGQVDSTTTARLWRTTRGNALLLRELVVAGLDQNALTDVDGVWRWQGPWTMAPRLMDLVRARLEDLDEDQLHVLELLAYGDPLGIDLLSSLAPVQAIEALERQGLLWVEQDRRRAPRVRPAHPLYVEALRRRCLGLRERARHQELVGAIRKFGGRRREDELQLAVSHVAVGGTAEPSMLVSAARQAWAAFDAPLAERLARAALDSGGGVEAASVISDVLVWGGRAEEAEALLDAFWSQPQPSGAEDEARARLTVARAFSLFWGLDRVEAAMEVLAEGERTIADRSWREGIVSIRGRFLAHSGRYAAALELLDELLGRPQPPNFETTETAALMAKALAAASIGSLAEAAAAVRRARRLLPRWHEEVPWLGEMIELAGYLTQALDGDLRGAAATAATLHAGAVEHPDYQFSLVLSCTLRGQASRQLGQVQDALRWLREGRRQVASAPGEDDSGALTALCAAELAHAAALAGDHDLAGRALAEAYASRRASQAIFDPWIEISATWVSGARGATGQAVEQALACARQARETGALAYEPIALHDAVRLGAAERVVEQLGQLAVQAEGQLVDLYAAHALAAARQDGPSLDQVAAGFEAAGTSLLAAEAAAQAALAHQRAGRQASARTAAASAARYLEACQGGWTPALGMLQAPRLTPRELEIAKLASQGMTNREIAERLVTSVRTVDNHLHQAYSKLGIRGREDLGRFFAGDRST
jgi:DNA-binding NarL/FixJ family response regulator/tetratricopeptide (TPR) repeat protein